MRVPMEGVEMEGQTRSCVIAHLSDLHTGSQYFVPNLLDRALVEVNEVNPDIVIVTGDLTSMGYRQEFREAREYIDRLTCRDVLVVPGNHDSRNVGYAHFERLFATRETVVRKNGVTVVGVDSTEPDLDYGRIGRHRYPWIRESFLQQPSDFKVFALHHHLLPIPAGSEISSTTPATCSRCLWSVEWSWCFRGTNMCPTPGALRTCGW